MKKYTIPFFLLGSLVMIYVMAKTGAPLKTASTPLGILDLEFAYNTAKTSSVINAWATSDNIAAAKLNTWLDFLFLFFYSFFLFFASKRIAGTFQGVVAKTGQLVAKGALAAGFLDILENMGMLIALNSHISGSIAFCTTFFSVIKWGLAIIAVLYVITGTLALAYRKIKN
jgi:hypothetical protein